MTNPFEIIAGVSGNAPKVYPFESLKSIRDDVESIMLLWNSNSYYINVKDKLFIINGGRKICFPELGECRLIYRKRTSQNVAALSVADSLRVVSWIFGLESAMSGNTVMLLIAEHGDTWEWINTL